MDKEYIVAAYIGDGGMAAFSDDDAYKLTHLNYAFGLVRDGEVSVSHLKNLGLLARVKQLNPKLKAVLSIGGWGAGGFSEAASSKEGRERFADTAIRCMKAHGFDGIDIDWEYPCSSAAGIASSPEDKHNFTLMIEVLREKLDNEYLLTIAAGAGEYFINDTEMDRVQGYLDFVNLMTYDMRGSFQKVTGHHTNLFSPTGEPDGISADRSVKLFNEAGVPREKMVLGAAFYSRVWSGVNNANNGLQQQAQTSGGTTYEYTRLEDDFIDKNGFTRYWDDISKAPYLFNGEIFISYDDEESLEYKAKYIKDHGLAGIMFWEYYLDKHYKLPNKLYLELIGK